MERRAQERTAGVVPRGQDVLRLTGRQAQEYLLGWAEAARKIRILRERYAHGPGLCMLCCAIQAVQVIARDTARSMWGIGRRDACRVALGEDDL